MLITSKLEIDLRKPGFKQVAYAVQNDSNTRALEISLFLGSTPWEIPPGTTAAVSFRKMDLTSGLYDTLPDGSTKAVTFSENTLTAILAPQVLTCAGKVDLSIALYDSSLNRLGVFPILLYVSTDPSAGKSISNNYYYLSTLAAVNEAIGNLDDLETKDKSSLVAAINEAAKTGGNSGGNGDGLSITEKNLILQLFRNAAYTSAGMNPTFTQLETLWSGSGDSGGETPDEPDVPVTPTVTLTRISASYSGGSVPVGTAVTALTDIVVTAHYSDGTSATVTGYTLSGTIGEGSNIITVSYGGKTTTFTVTGIAESGGDENGNDPPFDDITWTDGLRISGSGQEYTGHANYSTTDYVDVKNINSITVEAVSPSNMQYMYEFYDSDKVFVSGGPSSASYLNSDSPTYPASVTIEVPETIQYCRICGSRGIYLGDDYSEPISFFEAVIIKVS